MTKDRARFLLVASLLWLVFSFAAMGVHSLLGPRRWNAWPASPPFIFYSLCLFLPLALFWMASPLFAYFRRAPLPHRLVVYGFVCVMFAGHIANASRYTFPFMDWQMFTRAWKPEKIVHYDYWATRADRSRHRLNPIQVARSLDQSRFYLGHKYFAEASRLRDEERLWEIHDELFVALARLANRKQPQSPITQIEIERRLLDPNHPGEELAPGEIVRTIPVDPQR